MRFTEPSFARAALAVTVLATLVACSTEKPGPTVVPVPSTRPTPTPVQPAPGGKGSASAPKELSPPVAARNWDDFKKQAALRMVAANPSITYIGKVPDILLAIPVLEIELNSDGSVRRVEVLRYPRQATDTTQIAIDAVKRAGPYGDMKYLKKPWKFTEVFLFDDNRRFKPRTLDE